MDKRVKTRWLKALRSDKYKQGKGSLKTAKGNYCCLGVLCDLYRKSAEGKKNSAKWNEDRSFSSSDSIEYHDYLTLDINVTNWAGLDSQNPLINERRNKQYISLAEWNDNTKVGFKGIANKIEKHL